MPSLPIRAMLAAAILLVLLSATPALASTDAQRAAAQRDIERAVEAYKAGDVKTALKRFRAADEHAVDQAAVRYNIGRCLEELKRPLEARAAYRSMLDVSRLSADMRGRAQAKIDELESTALARLTVTCERSAQVRIGDQPAGPCPIERPLVEPELQEIVATTDDNAEARASIKPEAGQTSTVRLEFRERPVIGVGYDRIEGPVDTNDRVEDVAHIGGGSTTGPIVLSVVGGVALAAGGISLWQADAAFARARDAHSDYRSAIEPDEIADLRSTAQRELDDGALLANVGYGLLIGGGAALLGGLIWYATVDGSGGLGVRITPAPGGMVLGGAW